MSSQTHSTASEEQWLACAEPLKLPKLYPRLGARKRCLLMCAYALGPEHGFTAPAARAVVEAVRAAALASTENGTEGAARAALRASVPGYTGGASDRWHVSRRPEFVPNGSVLGWFLRECEDGMRTNTAVNSVAQYLLADVRAAAHNVAHGEMERVRRVFFGTDYRAAATDAFKDAVLELVPEDVRANVRRDNWAYGIPERVRNKVYAKHSRPAVERASAALVALAREVLGNPFRVPTISPAWREWDRGTVRAIAERVAETWDFSALPVLADALQDAGCEDEYLLAHLRSAGPHAPGCWALEAVLGRG
jgi:hypothetical protein